MQGLEDSCIVNVNVIEKGILGLNVGTYVQGSRGMLDLQCYPPVYFLLLAKKTQHGNEFKSVRSMRHCMTGLQALV